MLRPTTSTARAMVTLVSAAMLLAGCTDDATSPTIAGDQLAASPEPVEEPQPSPTPEASAPSPTRSASPEPPVATAAPAESTPPPTPTFDEVCAGRDDESFIEVLTPAEGAQVADGFTVTGCGNTFEATYLYRVELADGTVATEGFGTMSCGSGCVGEFTQQVDVGATGEVTLVVFESSPEDGSEMNVVSRTLTIG